MLHPLVKLVEFGVIEGKGLVAQGIIRAGEVVSQLEPNQPMTSIQELLSWPPEKQEAFTRHSYQFSEEYFVSEQGPEKHMNHSCDPNTWWKDDFTMVARRDILPGEELTYDYATTELAIPFTMTCMCGSARCRGVITHQDYLDPEWQARFGDYLPTHTRNAIQRVRRMAGLGG